MAAKIRKNTRSNSQDLAVDATPMRLPTGGTGSHLVSHVLCVPAGMAATSMAWVADTSSQVQPHGISCRPCATCLWLPIASVTSGFKTLIVRR